MGLCGRFPLERPLREVDSSSQPQDPGPGRLLHPAPHRGMGGQSGPLLGTWVMITVMRGSRYLGADQARPAALEPYGYRLSSQAPCWFAQ